MFQWQPFAKALMLENLQRTSTHHIGLQPNSRIGEEMSQNSFIKQYLAKQQELLRQRLEREAREAAETDGTAPEDHTEANDSTMSPAPNQDAASSLADQHKPLTTASEGDELRKEKEISGQPSHSADAPPAAIASLLVRVVGESGPTLNYVQVNSDDESKGGGDNDDEWKRKEISQDLRKKIVDLHNSGSSLGAISKRLKVPRSSVQTIVRKYKHHGTTQPSYRSGRRRILSPTDERSLVQKVQINPRTTAKDLVKMLEEAGRQVSISTVKRVLYRQPVSLLCKEEFTAPKPP
ncbi:uncharacterized protein LOC127645217 isoform X2 [Xyrauchen texanus]|uniref:uncharacterized protein LOC127645217 isoform X2 n=1 Tax=Xyrauchen texanus TaxID=154827 RepID=UPI002242C2A9|nr:uncharacterized protein LOC127645217 isoform X2 [Xyrauchen texanus]